MTTYTTVDSYPTESTCTASCAGDQAITTVDSASSFQDNSITLGSDNFPVISYYDSTNGDLKVVKCNNAACTP